MRQVWTKRSIRQAIREVKEFEWEGDSREEDGNVS